MAYSIAILHLPVSAMSAVTLGNTVRNGAQVQFTVTGDSAAIYIIEASTNLRQWFPIGTNRQIAVIRTVTVDLSQSQTYYRARVARPFTAAIVATNFIQFGGSQIQVDSYDSANPNFSTGGQYDPSKALDRGDLVVHSGVTNSLVVSNANVYGTLVVGLGGSPVLGPAGCVGSAAWVNNPVNAGTVEPGHLREEAGSAFPDVVLPSLPAAVPTGGTVGGVAYTYILVNGAWRLSNLTLASTQKMLVAGHAILHVIGNVTLGGSSTIIIAPDASLALYVGGVADFRGAGVSNRTGRATAFQYYGLNSNTSLTVTGDFTGTICAPRAHVSISGNAFDFSGAVIAASVSVHGTYHLHYDEDLAVSGPLF